MRTAISLLAILGAVYLAFAGLPQPSCNDNDSHASQLFETARISRICQDAIASYEADLRKANEKFTDFISVTNDFEKEYNRLCRWQRLIKTPPQTRKEHEGAFKPVQQAFDSLTNVDRDLWVGYGQYRQACGVLFSDGEAFSKGEASHGDVATLQDEL